MKKLVFVFAFALLLPLASNSDQLLMYSGTTYADGNASTSTAHLYNQTQSVMFTKSPTHSGLLPDGSTVSASGSYYTVQTEFNHSITVTTAEDLFFTYKLYFYSSTTGQVQISQEKVILKKPTYTFSGTIGAKVLFPVSEFSGRTIAFFWTVWHDETDSLFGLIGGPTVYFMPVPATPTPTPTVNYPSVIGIGDGSDREEFSWPLSGAAFHVSGYSPTNYLDAWITDGFIFWPGFANYRFIDSGGATAYTVVGDGYERLLNSSQMLSLVLAHGYTYTLQISGYKPPENESFWWTGSIAVYFPTLTPSNTPVMPMPTPTYTPTNTPSNTPTPTITPTYTPRPLAMPFIQIVEPPVFMGAYLDYTWRVGTHLSGGDVIPPYSDSGWAFILIQQSKSGNPPSTVGYIYPGGSFVGHFYAAQHYDNDTLQMFAQAYAATGSGRSTSAVGLSNIVSVVWPIQPTTVPATHTPTHTPTATNTAGPDSSPIPTNTPTRTATYTPTNTATATQTRTPSNTPRPDDSPRPTNTPTNTSTRTNTPTNTPTFTPTWTPDATSTPTWTPLPDATILPTWTPIVLSPTPITHDPQAFVVTEIVDFDGFWIWDRADIIPPAYQNAGANGWNIYYTTGEETELSAIMNELVMEIPYPTVRYDMHFSIVNVTYSLKATWEDAYGESVGLIAYYRRENTPTPTNTSTPMPTATRVPEYTNVNFLFHEVIYRPLAYRTPIN